MLDGSDLARASARLSAIVLAGVCAMCAAVSAIGPAQNNRPQTNAAAAAGRPHEIVTVVVPASAPWTDTGVTVKQGDGIAIRSWGRVRFDETRSAPPSGSGSKGGGCTFVVTNPTISAHSVVANIASGVTFDGHGFYVGPAWNGTVPVPGSTSTEGHLLLGFNDDGMLCDRSGYDSWAFAGSNAGAFTVEIAITRAR
jgi:hypothetical protein